MNDQLWWFVARASGTTAWLMLGASVIIGLLTTTRAAGRRHRRPWLVDVHRSLGGLSSLLVLLHLIAVIADTYESFGLVETFVPFASSWRPAAVAWGIVGFYSMLAVELSSLYQRSIPNRVWRWIHTTGFATFWLLTAHAFYAGSDAGGRVARGLGVGLSLAIAVLTTRRLIARLGSSTGDVPLEEGVPLA